MTTEVFATINAPQEVTKEMVMNLLVGLMENGYSSWLRSFGKCIFPRGLTSADFKEGGSQTDPDCYFAPTQIILVTAGCSVDFIVDDPQSDGGTKTMMVGPDALRRGLQLMAEKHPKLFQEIIDGNDDANTADVFGQLVVYGEEVYG